MTELDTAPAPLIEVRGLSVRAGAMVLLDGVDFEVRSGEILTLFGPSGAGKTTLAAALAGALAPGLRTTGVVTRTGVRVGYLPQNAAATLNPARRVGTALGELLALSHREPGRTGRGRRRARTAALLATAAFEIPDRELDAVLRRFPFEFSGGERARLALAQVLATRPDVLVVDEPTVGLDLLARSTLIRTLVALRATGTAIVLVTHDPVAGRIGDRTLHLRDGAVVPATTDTATPARRPASLPPTPPRALLRARSLSVTRRRTPILRDVDLDLAPGELVCLVGVSGAGKSTLARCLAGLTPLRGGSIALDGVTLPTLDRRTRAQIALVQYVWQESAASFDPRRAVLDQVAATGVRLRGLGRSAAEREALALLDRLGLTEAQARRRPAELSGGQLQRAALARALPARPRVLLCDEITTALDIPTARRILDVVDEYRHDTGAAVLSIGHDLDTQFARADRVIVLDEGRVVALGTPAELTAGTPVPVLARLLAAADPPTARPDPARR